MNAVDLIATRSRLPATGVAVTKPTDFNRGRRVDAFDLAITRRNYGAVSRVRPRTRTRMRTRSLKWPSPG